MSYKFLDNVDLTKNQLLNHVIQNLGTAPAGVLGLNYFDTTSNTWNFYNGTSWINPLARANHTGTQLAATISDFAATAEAIRLDQFAVPAASISLNSHNAINMLDPVNPQDGATKHYVDMTAQGFSSKGSAAAATVAALPVNTYSNGTAGVGATLTANTVSPSALVVDGYTVALNDLVLVQNEATAANNGLYVQTQVGTTAVPYILTRATVMDTSTEFTGAYVVVAETSTTQGGAILLCNQQAPTVGTTAITFTRINQIVNYLGDEISIHKSGSTFSILSTYPGQASLTTLGTISTGTWQGTPVALLYGGTGATTAVGARTNLGATGKYAATIGDGTALSFAITHNLNTQDCVVSIRDVATNTEAMTTTVFTDVNNVTVSFAQAPATGQYRVVVVG